MRKNVIYWISILCLLFVLVMSYVIRFNNPELTETQLFFKLWPLILLAAMSYFGLQWTINKK
mgnify:CR=1 FL=1